MSLESQFRDAAAGDFTGAFGVDNGRFDFTSRDRLPRAAQLCLASIIYRQPAGALDTLRVILRGQHFAPFVLDAVLLHKTGAEIADPAGGFSAVLGCFLLPRFNDGTHWSVLATTQGKTGDAAVTLDFHISPNPERAGDLLETRVRT